MLSAQLSDQLGMGAKADGSAELEQQALMKELEEIITRMDMI